MVFWGLRLKVLCLGSKSLGFRVEGSWVYRVYRVYRV